MHPQTSKRRLIIGVSGASGIQYAITALKLLRDLEVETHLVVSKAGHLTRAHETLVSREELEALASFNYGIADVGAALPSGSFGTMGIIILPCSMRTLGAIATGLSDSLLTRAADVTLKERRRLVLMTRETPGPKCSRSSTSQSVDGNYAGRFISASSFS